MTVVLLSPAYLGNYIREGANIKYSEHIYVGDVQRRIRFEIDEKLAALHFAKNGQNL